MNTEIPKIAGISPELLHRYVEMRRKVADETETIHSITSMLALFETSGDEKMVVDPVALGKINQILNTNILNIWEILDDFIYIVQAELELEKLESDM